MCLFNQRLSRGPLGKQTSVISRLLASSRQITLKFGSILIERRSFQRRRWIFLNFSMSKVEKNRGKVYCMTNRPQDLEQ